MTIVGCGFEPRCRGSTRASHCEGHGPGRTVGPVVTPAVTASPIHPPPVARLLLLPSEASCEFPEEPSVHEVHQYRQPTLDEDALNGWNHQVPTFEKRRASTVCAVSRLISGMTCVYVSMVSLIDE